MDGLFLWRDLPDVQPRVVGVNRSPLSGVEARALECTSGLEKREGERRSAGSHCGLDTRQVWRKSCSVAKYSERLRWHWMV